ncbi:MAG: MFS transporter [Actinomycetota bacterium]|nr:MFS transporter [Actinomycetota bacterium]MDH5223394.1 MFS transporter [Actinomycetota bacterium]MDH5313118.1 MFS transporter [Actinomycetota bacterium]
MYRALRGRDFRLLTLSAGFSSLGDELALIALTIKVADLTESGWAVAGLLLCGLIPLVIFAPAAGVIVDNFETRRSLAIATAIQAGVAVALAFTNDVGWIFMFTFLLGTASAVETPSIYTLVPRVVGDEHATEANAYLEAARYSGMIAGPVLAGTLAAGVGTKVALLVNAGTFVVIAAAAMLLRVRRVAPEEARAEEGAARQGFRVIRGDRVLVVAFAVIGAVVLFAAMDNVAEVFFARETLAAGAWGYGVLASAWLVGMVAGATLIARRLRDDRLLWSMALAAVVNGAAVFAAAAASVFWLAVALFVVGGLANGVETVAMRSLIVHRVADRFRGRAFASYGALVNGMQIGATGAAGAIVAGLGGRAALLIGGIGTALAGLAGLIASRSLDRREASPKPPTPTTVKLPEAEPGPQADRPGVTRLPESEPVERATDP